MKISSQGFVLEYIKQLASENKDLHNELQLYRSALEHSYEGVIVVDHNGIIISVNETYAAFINQTADDVRGKHVTEVVENTRMHIVAKTGYPEIANVQEINGHHMIANRIPIIIGNKIVASLVRSCFKI
ncbi:sigma54 specific transcriptional regulator, Fis family [Geomicrobium sp. JCM 19037]|uniref:PAS domain S-box protein n=1 Tax=Geomicrobium sp. JCM 19037 TaxID=1460634 RepID=UPI00045F4A84|nr:PAS domain S-box protein [Geomicrobium sp. JCM 19037]GAK05865.1 sigma54 specific transcriptional regulator, Fis family [Geomicrobium sp. JCM 19037]